MPGSPVDGQRPMSHQDCNNIGRNKMAEPARAKPKPTPETQHFWDGTREANCACSAAMPAPMSTSRRVRSVPNAPRARSACSRRAARASSTATSSTIVRRRPASRRPTPSRWSSSTKAADDDQIVDCPQTPEALELDMKVEVEFETLDDKITLPLFRPAKGKAMRKTRLPSSARPRPPSSASSPTRRRSSCMRTRR